MESPHDGSLSPVKPRFNGSKLAEAIAAVHGAVPVSITGTSSDPAVLDLLRIFRECRAVPTNDRFRSKM